MLRWFASRFRSPGGASTPPETPAAPTPTDGPWIAVDLDGTLAEYSAWRGIRHVGRPIPLMQQRVLDWIAAGHRIKIFTARASVPDGIAPVKEWLAQHGFPDLEVTNCKDFQMVELWDDRAIQVITNTGKPVLRVGARTMPKAPLRPDEQEGITCDLAAPDELAQDGLGQK